MNIMHTDAHITLVYTTFGDIEAAKATAKYLLERKLVACANFLPITSMYPWQNQWAEDQETAALFKTTAACWQEVQKGIKAMHPYTTPCIFKISAEADASFASWILAQLR